MNYYYLKLLINYLDLLLSVLLFDNTRNNNLFWNNNDFK